MLRSGASRLEGFVLDQRVLQPALPPAPRRNSPRSVAILPGANREYGEGSRSSAFLGMRTNHHMVRGATVDAELSEEAAELARSMRDLPFPEN